MKVRLLNPSIYSLEPGRKPHEIEVVSNPDNYPVVVEVKDISNEPKIIQDVFKDRVISAAWPLVIAYCVVREAYRTLKEQ